MPGRHVTYHQMRLFMKYRSTDTAPVAAAKASFSTATDYRIEEDPQTQIITAAAIQPLGTKRNPPAKRPRVAIVFISKYCFCFFI